MHLKWMPSEHKLICADFELQKLPKSLRNVFYRTLKQLKTYGEYNSSCSEVVGDFLWRWNLLPRLTSKIGFHEACGCDPLSSISCGPLLAVFSRRRIQTSRSCTYLNRSESELEVPEIVLMVGRSRKKCRNISRKSARESLNRFRRIHGH